MTLTLGQFLIAVAAVDLVVIGAMARRLPEAATPEQRSGRRFLLVAVVALAIGLCLIALFVPSISRIPLI